MGKSDTTRLHQRKNTRYLNSSDSEYTPRPDGKRTQTSTLKSKRVQSSSSFLSRSLKSLFQRHASVTSNLVDAARVSRQHFGLNHNSFLVATLCATNIAMAILIPTTNSLFRRFIILQQAEKEILYPFMKFLTAVCANSIVHAINSMTCRKVRNDLAQAMNNKFSKDALLNNFAYGKDFLPNAKELKNITQSDVTESIKTHSTLLTRLANDRLSVLTHFIGSVYALIQTSSWFLFSFYGTTVSIPVLLIITFSYAIIYNILSTRSSNALKTRLSERNDNFKTYKAQHRYIDANKKEIALRKGKKQELNKTQMISQKTDVINRKMLFPQFFRSFLNKMHWELSMVLALFSKKSTEFAVTVLQVSKHIRGVIEEQIWNEKHLDEIKKLDIASTILAKINEALANWKTLFERYNNVYYFKSEKIVKIESLTIQAPQNTKSYTNIKDINLKPLFNGLKVTIKPGDVVQLKGPNGSGKSTLFCAIAKIWPFANGFITIPKDTMILPQNPLIVSSAPLLETIYYPQKPTKDHIGQIIGFMRQFKLSEQRIIKPFQKECENLKAPPHDWSKLSRGEQQTIALISALIQKPQFLLMDEPFASLDVEKVALAKHLIKQHLINTENKSMILYIDHGNANKAENTMKNTRILKELQTLVKGQEISQETQAFLFGKTPQSPKGSFHTREIDLKDFR